MSNKFSYILNKNSLIGISYTLFEGLSKGGNQILLLLIVSLLSTDLYLKIMLLTSFQALSTMLYISYYSDVVYSLKYNKSRKGLMVSFDVSIIQYIILLLFYYLFKSDIDNYFSLDLWLLMPIILANGFTSNIIRFFSIIYQMELEHKKAITYKSIPFFTSFIFSLIFFLLLKDKILGFFLGRFIGLFIFFLYAIFDNKFYKLLLKSNKYYFGMIIKRAKYSFFIAVLGWSTGLGFLNFVKFYSNDTKQLVTIGIILNIFTILQLFSNGINQVYTPSLKSALSRNIESGRKYSQKAHILYSALSLVFLAISAILLFLKPYLILHFPQFDQLIRPHLYVIVFLFFTYQFYAIAYPYLMILDKYQYYFLLVVLLDLVAWGLVFILLLGFNYKDFIFYYCLIKVFEWAGIYIFVSRSLKKQSGVLVCKSRISI